MSRAGRVRRRPASRRPGRFLRALALGLVLLLLAAACGHRGPPIPPQPRQPTPPSDASFRQRGALVEMRALYRLEGLEGRRVRPPLRPVLLYVVRRGESERRSWLSSSRDREFQRAAIEFAMTPFPEDKLGEIERRDDAVPIAELAPDEGGLVLALALADERTRSAPTARAALSIARPALAPLARFVATPEEEGVRLRFEGADERLDAVRIYREVDGEGSEWEPWRIIPLSEGEAFDEAARYGQRLVYRAAGAIDAMGAPVESELVVAGPIDYRDVFPPRVPSDVDAVALAGRVRVLWTPGGSEDEARWIVERAPEDGETFRRIGEALVPDAFFVDEEVSSDQRYVYRVVGVDEAGNESAPSSPSRPVSPRPAEEAR